MENRTRLTELLFNYEANLMTSEELILAIEHLYQSEPKVSLEVRIGAFKREVWSWNARNKNKYTTDLLNAFYNLWTRIETNGNLKFENESKFLIGGRLATFWRMNKQFQQSSQVNKIKQSLGMINPLR